MEAKSTQGERLKERVKRAAGVEKSQKIQPFQMYSCSNVRNRGSTFVAQSEETNQSNTTEESI